MESDSVSAALGAARVPGALDNLSPLQLNHLPMDSHIMSPAEPACDECQNVPGPQHRIFSIQEVLREIFQWLSPGQRADADDQRPSKTSSRMRETLYRAALVCAAFQGPALDILWRDLDSVRPLSNIVDLYGSDISNNVNYPFVHLTPHARSRFLFHSSRIHTLRFCRIDFYGTRDEGLLNGVAFELKSRSQAQCEPVFPCLESLHWYGWGNYNYSYKESLDEDLVITFLSHCPALRRFEMFAHVSSESLTTEFLGRILRKLHETVPMLQELSLGNFSDASLTEHYRLLSGFQALRVLKCPVISLPMLRFCARLENLAEFRLALTMSPAEEYGDVCLRTVRSLRVEGSMDNILHFLGSVTYPLLTSLEIYNNNTTPNRREHFPRDLKTLSAMFAPYQALRTLRLHTLPPKGHFWLVELVAPLLELRQLEEVAINAFPDSRQISLSDDDLCKLASSWPRLRALEIHAPDFRGRPYICALAAFARFCPDLHSLQLPEIAFPSDLGPVPAVCHSLRYLHIGWPRFTKDSDRNFVARPVQVARFLHKMFPNVARNEDDGCDVYGWMEVNEAWAALRAGEDVNEPDGRN
ncbi:hypothetical protein B0H21DRAFT_891348 [Amylocystis lapponica]|nr:hypothetical protein B0H21DRAFT_891348 [Amylocystis lapponica]